MTCVRIARRSGGGDRLLAAVLRNGRNVIKRAAAPAKIFL